MRSRPHTATSPTPLLHRLTRFLPAAHLTPWCVGPLSLLLPRFLQRRACCPQPSATLRFTVHSPTCTIAFTTPELTSPHLTLPSPCTYRPGLRLSSCLRVRLSASALLLLLLLPPVLCPRRLLSLLPSLFRLPLPEPMGGLCALLRCAALWLCALLLLLVGVSAQCDDCVDGVWSAGCPYPELCGFAAIDCRGCSSPLSFLSSSPTSSAGCAHPAWCVNVTCSSSCMDGMPMPSCLDPGACGFQPTKCKGCLVNQQTAGQR